MRGRPHISRALVGLAGLACAVLLLGFFVFATIATRDVAAQPPRADGIVVLTGGQMRIAEAGRLLENGYGRRLLVSGINKKTTKNDIRRLIRIRPEMFECCVDLGYWAQNTRGNAEETRAWADTHDISSLIVVTASYHMPRSMTELATELPNVTLIAHPVMPKQFQSDPWWLNSGYARILAAEYIKFLPTAARLGFARLTQAQNDNAQAPTPHKAAGRTN